MKVTKVTNDIFFSLDRESEIQTKKRERRMIEMKKLFLLFLIGIFILTGTGGNKNRKTSITLEEITPTDEITPTLDKITPVKEIVSIVGVGDIMLGTGKNILTDVESITKDADITFGNLEGVLLTKGGTPKICDNCFSFRMPDNYVEYLKEAGFDILSLANNHINDFGKVGRENTVKVLKNAGIRFAGLRDYPYTIFEKDGIKYGFCAFGPNYPNITNFDDATSIVKELNSKCDIVIVSLHMGAEGQSRRHISRKTEYFLGENRGNPYKLARTAIDAGADVVFGQGPHVPRAVDIYKGRFIAYSLGNFATYGHFDLNGVCGISPIVKIWVNKKGEFISGRIYSVKLIGSGIPVVDKDQKALKEVINLTKSDVPETGLIIKTDGVIERN